MWETTFWTQIHVSTVHWELREQNFSNVRAMSPSFFFASIDKVEWGRFAKNRGSRDEVDKKRDGALKVKIRCEDVQTVVEQHGSDLPQDVRISKAEVSSS